MRADEMACKTEAQILRRLAQVKQAHVAEDCHMSAAKVSRIAAGEGGIKLPELGGFLCALGLRLVDEDMRYVQQDEYEALRTLARVALEDKGKGR